MALIIDYPGEALPARPREPLEHEELIVRRGQRSGVYCAIAVHCTVLGPALGGCRMWSYPTVDEGIDDALRLSRAMTMKAAAAGLPLGGGKGVICLPPNLSPSDRIRHELLRDFAETIDSLGGRYITAEDVGTNSADMAVVARFTKHVVGRPREAGGSGDPGDYTAAGVEASMRAVCQHLFASPELTARRIAIVGCGSVGSHLARRLARVHASLVLSDVDPARKRLARELGADWMEPEQALTTPLDVLAPCAMGGVIHERLVERLRCRAICGAANNQLVDQSLAERLQEREILYAPDFIVNAGGLINVSGELNGYDPSLAIRRVAELQHVLARVLREADRRKCTPLAAARAQAETWLSAGRALRAAG
ncbi:MAG TPA: Glu/Leu/Phe/Val dehydrogenase dimerization domain-containing protein [Solirubrobacteraceae bacterium]|jgi:leucine dehydrogenase|nr:Glu/Leu/Phe/Val dehydrogenase dimerization domain-containing protein [Solirubrobacteraceae bacterium]